MNGDKPGRRRQPWITIAVNAEFTIGKRQVMRILKIIGGMGVTALLILAAGMGFPH
jgi:hypothetical protein